MDLVSQRWGCVSIEGMTEVKEACLICFLSKPIFFHLMAYRVEQSYPAFQPDHNHPLRSAGASIEFCARRVSSSSSSSSSSFIQAKRSNNRGQTWIWRNGIFSCWNRCTMMLSRLCEMLASIYCSLSIVSCVTLLHDLVMKGPTKLMKDMRFTELFRPASQCFYLYAKPAYKLISSS